MWQTAVRRACVAGLVASITGLGVARAAAPGAGESATAGAGVAGGDAIPAAAAPSASSGVPEPANLMTGLDKIGVGKTLDDLGIDIYGHVEGGLTYEFLRPGLGFNGRRYDFIPNRGLLNQAAVNFERVIPTTSNHFDVGFRVQALEGTDAGFTESLRAHSGVVASGQTTETDALFDVGGNKSNYQFDLPDAYVDFGIPLGNGVRVRAGRFEFFKPIDPNTRLFYSTTYVYTNVLPFTNTGVTAAYDFSKAAGIEAGFSRGYDVTVDDTNGTVDFIGKGHVDLDKATALTGTTSVGPDLAHDSRDYTALIDLALSHKFSKAVSVFIDAVYDHQFGSGTIPYSYSPEVPTFPHLPASFYGVSGNAFWKLNAYVRLAGRVEWFRDDGGLLAGDFGRTSLTELPISRSLYEATAGVTLTPFPRDAIGENLKIRPEVRYDYSNRAFFGLDAAGTPTRKDQLTVGGDVIYNF